MKMQDYPKYFDHTVKVEVKDYIATITLDCPQNENHINEQFVDEFHQAILDIRYDDSVRVVVIRGEGDAFFGHGDVEKLIMNRCVQSELVARQFIQEVGSTIREMKECGKLIIACMDAPSIGGGCGFTLSCDIVFSTRKGAFAPAIHAAWGLVPDCGGIYAFARLCGPQKAMWYSARPNPVTAEEAYKDGLVAKVFDDADTMYKEAYELAEYIVNCPPYGMYCIKTMGTHAADFNFETYAAFEAEFVANGMHTKDFSAAAASAIENDPSKRVFVGY